MGFELYKFAISPSGWVNHLENMILTEVLKNIKQILRLHLKVPTETPNSTLLTCFPILDLANQQLFYMPQALMLLLVYNPGHSQREKKITASSSIFLLRICDPVVLTIHKLQHHVCEVYSKKVTFSNNHWYLFNLVQIIFINVTEFVMTCVLQTCKV